MIEEIEPVDKFDYKESKFVKDGPQCQHVDEGRCERCMNPLIPKSSIGE